MNRKFRFPYRPTRQLAILALLLVIGLSSCLLDTTVAQSASYTVVDTGQDTCNDDSGVVTCPAEGEAFYGQDAQYQGNQPSYTDNGDGTVTDNVTGLVWQQSPDTDGDGDIDASDKMAYDDAVAYCEVLSYAGYDDWQLPTIKQLYSLIDFSGVDPSGYEGTDTSGLIPFIDTGYFDFAYGDTDAGERIIDMQYASSTMYVADTGIPLLFGVNFADGRIKGYGITLRGQDKTFAVACIRENDTYSVNEYAANGDGTITDNATGLMWAQEDSGSDAPDGLNWEEALAYVVTKNEENYLGYSDWRLPNVKELQSIVDYSRSPDTTDSAAIDSLFDATSIVNEGGETDYAFYWSGTTHSNWTSNSGNAGAYVSFGRALGYMGGWQDVHGAGAQRSDPKSGDPDDFPTGHGPQGDAIRIYNYVRLVRDNAQDSGISYTLSLPMVTTTATAETGTVNTDEDLSGGIAARLVDTGQGTCYDSDGNRISCPAEGEDFYGQDAQFTGNTASYSDNGDGTVSDNVTGLTWQQTPDSRKVSWDDAQTYCEALTLAGSDDWRTPSLKELLSISDFESGWPYIDMDYFDLITETGQDKLEQYWSSNHYEVGTTHGGQSSAIGVNHGTGHIKAYPDGSNGSPMAAKYVRCVQGDNSLVNDFVDNGDGTVSDNATNLMWSQNDSGEGLDWESALAYAQAMNSENYLGYNDWRAPNVKELQSIVDYSGVYPAIDESFFNIADEDSYFWSSTSAYFSPSSPGYYYAWYVAFGYAVDAEGNDSHGAGAVRFDTKVEGGPAGEDPERIYNYVRLVRGGDVDETPDGDPTADDSVTFVEFVGDDGSGQSGPVGISDNGEGPGAGQPPDLAAAAVQLGLTEEELQTALGDPSQGPPDFAAAAQQLGVTEEDLDFALGIPSDGLPAKGQPPIGGQQATGGMTPPPIGESGTTTSYSQSTAAGAQPAPAMPQSGMQMGQPMPGGQGPDLAAAAVQLGVIEEALQAALGEPGQGPPDLATAAQQLGVTEDALIAALGLLAGGQPMGGQSPVGGQPHRPGNRP